jgi:cell fate (sporulation/competence/biofilm development) regulator YlbF (YheA/YmcA/DUF963 family)
MGTPKYNSEMVAEIRRQIIDGKNSYKEIASVIKNKFPQITGNVEAVRAIISYYALKMGVRRHKKSKNGPVKIRKIRKVSKAVKAVAVADDRSKLLELFARADRMEKLLREMQAAITACLGCK